MSDLYEALMQDPLNYHDACYDAGFRLTAEQLHNVQLAGIRKRFGELRPKLSVLDKLASEQGIDAIDSIDDIAPLMFPHTIYKSYPMSYLERARFDKLTRWLGGLTTEDLSQVDASGIDSIDAWLDLLDAETDLLVSHSSGTTGKLSFVPRTKAQWRQTVVHSGHMLRHWWGPDSGPDLFNDNWPVIIPGYRRGYQAAQRANDYMIGLFAGSEDNALFLYPEGKFSADIASLAGRLKSAEARGELGSLQVSDTLMQQREHLLAMEARRGQDLQDFFDRAIGKFGGKNVYIAGVWTLLFNWADQGGKRGLSNVFSKDSILFSGGGKKGQALPENYREVIKTFLGFDTVYEMYATSVLMAVSMLCEAGHYHFPPVLVPFLLDPDSGATLPRKDNVTGRLAMLDLMPNTYWAGLVTGDEVTWAGFDKPCACGRHGPFIYDRISRYSEKQGGDDKILCAGAPEAHDRALDFLAELSQ